MSITLLVARRELRAYLTSFLGFIVVAAALLAEGLCFNALALGSGAHLSSEVLQQFFFYSSGFTAAVAVILSMRLLAGEREQGSLVLLNTAPIKDSQIVAGKFLAALCVVLVKLVLSVPMPLLILVNGRISAGHVLVGYLGVALLGAAVLAIGMLGSAIARTQVIAVIIGGILLAVFYLFWAVARVTDPPINNFISALAIHHERQRPFMTGVLKLENVVYYVGIAYFFLLAATKTLEARRWR